MDTLQSNYLYGNYNTNDAPTSEVIEFSIVYSPVYVWGKNNYSNNTTAVSLPYTLPAYKFVDIN